MHSCTHACSPAFPHAGVAGTDTHTSTHTCTNALARTRTNVHAHGAHAAAEAASFIDGSTAETALYTVTVNANTNSFILTARIHRRPQTCRYIGTQHPRRIVRTQACKHVRIQVGALATLTNTGVEVRDWRLRRGGVTPRRQRDQAHALGQSAAGACNACMCVHKTHACFNRVWVHAPKRVHDACALLLHIFVQSPWFWVFFLFLLIEICHFGWTLYLYILHVRCMHKGRQSTAGRQERVRTHTRSHVRTRAHTYDDTRTLPRTHALTHACMHARPLDRTNARTTRAHVHGRARAHARARTLVPACTRHARTHARTHERRRQTCAQTFTHARVHSLTHARIQGKAV